jgi:O-antigen ligase/tetratricopeptide (TPR) repeat protein
MAILEKTLKWIVTGGIFLLPFIAWYVASDLFFPFITGKNFAFRIIIEVIAAAWLALALVSPEYRPRRSWTLGAFALYLFVLAVADVAGLNPVRSFWSNFERMDGWVTIAHLFAYLVVALSVMRERTWVWWWHVSLVSSLGISVYALFQLGGHIAIDQSSTRLDATLGNATYLGVYMLFHVFAAIFYGARSWRLYPTWRVLLMAFYGFVIALDSFVLFFTATRGAIIGLAGGLALAGVIYIVLEPRSRVAWRIGAVLVACAVLISGFWLARHAAWVQKIEPLQRIATISTSETTVAARFINWSMAWQGVVERPLLGWGQENYGLVFDKYYDPRMYGQEPWFDRVHEVLLDQMINAGILGLLAYLAIYAGLLAAIWQRGAFSSAEKSLLTGLVAGYFFYLLTTFDNVTSWILFVSLIAFVASRADVARNAAPLPAHGGVSREVLPVLGLLSVGVAWGLVWAINVPSITANHLLIQAISPHTEGAQTNLNAFKAALAVGAPVGTQEIREHLAQGVTSIAGSTSVPNDVKQQLYSLAVSQMEEMQKEVPLEARFPLFLGLLYDAYGQYGSGATALARAHTLSPAKQSILFELAMNQARQGDTQGALATFKQAYDLDTDYDDARALYAVMALQLGRNDLADSLVQPMIEKDTAYNSRVVAAYVATKRYGPVIAIMLSHAQKNPADAQARFSLAAAQYAAGDTASAIATLQQCAKDIPTSVDQAQQFIADMRSGKAKVQ